jgi:hypothetical protein
MLGTDLWSPGLVRLERGGCPARLAARFVLLPGHRREYREAPA